ncbi:MAG: choice-of-anchor tandem repeat GloVer-containing protein, partial [Terriglobales bacterium]
VILDSAGNLYGTTTNGGAFGVGVVFKVDTSGNETQLYTFTGGNDGAYPNGVIFDSASNLYGTTTYGGTSGAGVVFKLDTSGRETVLYPFTGGADGGYSDAGVIRDAVGNLYGTTSGGGTSGAGVVFKLDTSGNETVLYNFTGGNDGSTPYAGVVRDAAGILYGTTPFGGTAGLGVVFKVDTSGNETVLHTFVRGPYGNQPYLAGVILDSVGNLYGTTAFDGAGGQGAVYKLDPSGNPKVLYAFAGATDGQYPHNAGVIFGSNGNLYGTADRGGKAGEGVVYQLDGNGNEAVLYTFRTFTVSGFGQPTGNLIQDSKGNFYGTTFIGQADMGYGYGVVYKVGPAGNSTVLHNFTGGADGGDPYGGVIRDSKGNLYGTTQEGGTSGAGVVFKINMYGSLKVLYTFTGGTDGSTPDAGVIRDSKGNLYGTTVLGGASGAGVVFKVDTSGNETVLYSFTGGADGGYPVGGLVRDSKGNFYGTTNGGGASGAGVVFKLDTSGNETVLYTFTGGADGAYPYWVVLARDSAGNLYGTTFNGGASNAGVVFKVDTSGNETVLHSFTGGADGGNPYAGVTFGPGGMLYGTTPVGGRTNAGVVFQVEP